MVSYHLPRTDVQAVQSADGHAYSIFLGWPDAAPPPCGFPVVFVLDANAMFATVVEAVRLRTVRSDFSGAVSAVVVGIGYPTDHPLDMVRRTFDYTPDCDRSTLPTRPDGSPWPPTGGADAFLDLIEQSVIPLVCRSYQVDTGRLSILGHSFGGLLSLYALTARPGRFRCHVVSSPSIWVDRSGMLQRLQSFVSTASEGEVDLLLSVGSREQPMSDDPTVDAHAAWRRNNRMLDNTRDVAAVFAASRRSVSLAFNVFDGEDHVSVVPAMIGRAVSHICGANASRMPIIGRSPAT